MNFDLDFYKGKKVFVTGHTGFKGSWLCKMLVNAGAIVTGYSLNPPTTNFPLLGIGFAIPLLWFIVFLLSWGATFIMLKIPGLKDLL